MTKSFDEFMTCIMSGAVLTCIFGEVNKALIFLFIVMVTDFVTGLMCGAYNHRLSSDICIKGLMKKFMILVYVMVSHYLDYVLGVDYIKTSVCYMYATGEVISIIENGVTLGLPIPTPIKKALEMLNGGENNENS